MNGNTDNDQGLEVLHERCAGLDVHKESVVACVRLWSDGRLRYSRVQRFGTMTRELEALRDWLASKGVTHVAMESTGVYWKPVFNVLEEHFEVLVCNAYHVKQIRGRKTDRKDCEWLAQLLQYGLLRGSFVPPRPLRELRDLTRMRSSLAEDHTKVVNRIQKVLEDANIKLASVVTDIMGVSGRDILEALARGETDPEVLAQLARRQLRGKIPELREALYGHVTEHHRFLLRRLLRKARDLEAEMAELEERIEWVLSSPELAQVAEKTQSVPFPKAVELLDTVPGVNKTAAHALVAEIGTDMSRFGRAGHLASWAGVCPGNHESAGKRRTGRTGKGNRWLKAKLFQCAWAAARTKRTYANAAYRRWARKGSKKAVAALGHSLLVSIYRMLEEGVAYHDLGPDHFDQLHPDRLKRYHIKRLEALGYTVKVEPKAGAA